MAEIYLDNAATTRPWPEAVQAMEQVLGESFGNASSLHTRGVAAARAVTGAKEAIEEAVGSGPWKVIFTSGGSESDTMAVLGSVPRGKRDHVVTTTLEHAAVSDACQAAAAAGARVTEVPGGLGGVIDPHGVADAVDEKTALVTICHVAGELGTVQPVAYAARLVKAKAPKCRVHVDAVQALGQLEKLDYPGEIDMVSLSSHKVHGPQGVGALLLRPTTQPRQLIYGGDQQGGLRPGTLNLPGIVGFGAAVRRLSELRGERIAAMQELTDRLVSEVTMSVDGVRPLGAPERRAPGIAVLAVHQVTPEVLLHSLEARGVLASSGSACHSTRKEPPRSYVDAGLEGDEGALRLSLSVDTTAEEVELAIDAIADAVEAVREGRASAP